MGLVLHVTVSLHPSVRQDIYCIIFTLSPLPGGPPISLFRNFLSFRFVYIWPIPTSGWILMHSHVFFWTAYYTYYKIPIRACVDAPLPGAIGSTCFPVN